MSAHNPNVDQPAGRPFAARVQQVLVFLMGISFVMIAQQASREVYKWGVLSLVAFTLLQIAFGNIPPHFNFRKSILSLALAALIIGGIVVLSINLVPTLLRIGR